MAALSATKLILAVVMVTLVLAPAAFAGDTAKSEYLKAGAGGFDLKRYSLAEMLNRHFTVASGVTGGVRCQVHERAGQKTLVID